MKPEMKSQRIRDLSIVELPGDILLISACDSLGAIGPKELDQIPVPADFVGRALARVPLMEVMAAGAEPILLLNTLCVEMEPSGKEIIRGIVQELKKAGIDPSLVINGSTKKMS